MNIWEGKQQEKFIQSLILHSPGEIEQEEQNAFCLFLKQQSNLDYKNTLLFYAISNEYEKAYELIQSCSNTHEDFHDAFCYAAQFGQQDTVDYFIQKGANIHFQNDRAFRMAVTNGHLDIADLLLQLGSNVSAADDWALATAASNGNLPIVQYLVNHGANINGRKHKVIKLVCRKGHLHVLNYLIENKADLYQYELNHQGEKINENLKIAIQNNHPHIVERLLQAGLSPSTVSLTNVELDYLLSNEKNEIINFLSEQQFSLDYEYIIKKAAHYQNDPIFYLCLEHGAGQAGSILQIESDYPDYQALALKWLNSKNQHKLLEKELLLTDSSSKLKL